MDKLEKLRDNLRVLIKDCDAREKELIKSNPLDAIAIAKNFERRDTLQDIINETYKV